MGIKRNEVADPEWDEGDYAVRSKEDIFSLVRWKKTVDWEIILRQAEKTRQASQMIDAAIYPSTVFFAAIDLLEANLYMIDDMFYYLTGLRMTTSKVLSDVALNAFGFWNMDCYKVLEQIEDNLKKTKEQLIECLKHESVWDIALKVADKKITHRLSIGDTPIHIYYIDERCTNAYARDHYKAEQTDQEALASQIASILMKLDRFKLYFFFIYYNQFPFSKLLEMFRQSEKAQTDYIEPWRHDFGGTRDSLIAKMEKDPKLAPWVHKYDHLTKNEEVEVQLFHDYNRGKANPIDKEACYNTDNWLSILTVAAVLEEYDELHQTDSEVDEDDDEDMRLKLELYFKDEATVQRFLKSVKDMNDTEIITLVKKYWQAGLCTDKSKALWRVLHDAGLYTAKYSNWNGLLSKP